MTYELSKNTGIAIFSDDGYYALKKGIRTLKQISKPYTRSVCCMGNDYAQTEVLGICHFVRITGVKVTGDTANEALCGFQGKVGEECRTEAVFYNRNDYSDGTFSGSLVPVTVVTTSFLYDGDPEKEPFVEFQCDIYVNGRGTEGTFEILGE